MSEGRLEPRKSTQTTCRVLANYQAAYPEPIVVCAGEGLVVGKEDPEYPGWIWCTDTKGKGGWVPDDCVERTGGSAKARYDYAATELSASAGDELVIIEVKSGWAWCINGSGQSGWLPIANLERKAWIASLKSGTIIMAYSFLNGQMKGITKALVSLVFVVWGLGVASAQLPSQDPGPKQDAEVRGIKFSVPKGFNLEKLSDSGVAFMRHEKYDLALFIAVPEKQVDDAYLTSLSNGLVSQLFPKENDFRWKLLPSASDSKVSKFQTTSGSTKGFNNRKFFQTHYITVKVKDRDVLVGYITQLGQFSNNAKYLFDLNGDGGMSMPGWYAQAHILASVTGEKYQEINPGTFIRTTPVKD